MTTDKTITRDVTYRIFVSHGVNLELQFFGDSSNPRLVVWEQEGKKKTVVLDALAALGELVQIGHDHVAELRYQRQAAERKAKRDAELAAEQDTVQPPMTADYSGDDES